MNNWDGIVSLFIACIELVLIINILIFSERTSGVKMALYLIALLMGYQVMEFIICGLENKSSAAAFIAFADITLLPPVSVMFALSITGKYSRPALLFFIPAFFFIIFYGFLIPDFKVVKCTAFYAAYNYPAGDYYGFFFYSPVIFSMIIFYLYRRKEINKKEKILSTVILTGYIITAIPVIIAFSLSVSGSKALLSIIESVMCKTAVFIALAAGIYSLSYLKKK